MAPAAWISARVIRDQTAGTQSAADIPRNPLADKSSAFAADDVG